MPVCTIESDTFSGLVRLQVFALMEREALRTRVRILNAIHQQKQSEWQNQHNYSDEVGCITRESLVLASLVPEILRHGLTIESCVNNEY